MVKGQKTCAICGRDFPLIVEEHYIARDDEKTGLVNAVSGSESRFYDAIDCPHCGSQNILQERKRAVEEDDNCDDGRGCEGCIYTSRMKDEMPCAVCSRNHMDHYEEAK